MQNENKVYTGIQRSAVLLIRLLLIHHHFFMNISQKKGKIRVTFACEDEIMFYILEYKAAYQILTGGHIALIFL